MEGIYAETKNRLLFCHMSLSFLLKCGIFCVVREFDVITRVCDSNRQIFGLKVSRNF